MQVFLSYYPQSWICIGCRVSFRLPYLCAVRLASASHIHNELLKSVTIPIISRTAALYNLCITISMQLRESPPAHPHPISATYCDQCPSFTYFSQLNWESHKTGRVLLIKMDCRVTQKNIFFWMVCIITPWCYWRWYFTWVTEFL